MINTTCFVWEKSLYDKHNCFKKGSFSPGDRHLTLEWKGIRFSTYICYDLRFPVWLRNTNNSYDLLLIVASWPTPRIKVWETLLYARAMENQSYVCGVNRIGKDGNNLDYPGKSMLLDAKGGCLTSFKEGEENIQTVEIDIESLQSFRDKFPVWKDADSFILS